ncbi:putative DNA-binding protein [Haloimpatiens sp. FM7315]|uniref:putative DNA-binding protein n=1 Tax=Haloimpatiens sp. FM7315 TaxID=3298609 RepID=UPI00370C52EE
MEKRVEISMLLDFYGSLLTCKQRDIMDLYYNDDLSLSEISEITNTSRQAIYDITKRCYKLLTEYESKLLLLNKHIQKEKKINKIISSINKLADNISQEDSKKILFDIKEDIVSI